MKPAQALAHFRQLSCLGLPAPLVVPAMLQALHDVVPSCLNVFHWTNRKGNPVNTYTPEMNTDVLEVFTSARHLLQGPGEPTIERLVTGPAAAGNYLRYQNSQFERSAIFNLVNRPVHVGPSLDLAVRRGVEPLGLVLLHREIGAVRFSAADTAKLATLAPYFVHALIDRAGGVESGELRDSGEEAALLCDREGRLVQAGGGAWQMLVFSSTDRIGPATTIPRPGTMLSPAIQRLCRNLCEIRLGRPAPAPMTRVENAWGAYRFQAHPLRVGLEASPSPDDLVVVTIRREAPVELKLMERLKTLPLTPKQRQIAFRLGMGDTPDAAAQALDISRETCRSYVKQMYSRLDINNRGALMDLLVA